MTSVSGSRSSASWSTSDRPSPGKGSLESELQRALGEVWLAVLELPQDGASFEAIDPQQRRDAHDLGVRIQDRLLGCLTQLVEGMATDGVELVDGQGVPTAFHADDSGQG